LCSSPVGPSPLLLLSADIASRTSGRTPGEPQPNARRKDKTKSAGNTLRAAASTGSLRAVTDRAHGPRRSAQGAAINRRSRCGRKLGRSASVRTLSVLRSRYWWSASAVSFHTHTPQLRPLRHDAGDVLGTSTALLSRKFAPSSSPSTPHRALNTVGSQRSLPTHHPTNRDPSDTPHTLLGSPPQLRVIGVDVSDVLQDLSALSERELGFPDFVRFRGSALGVPRSQHHVIGRLRHSRYISGT
jgi:hypothetical protein